MREEILEYPYSGRIYRLIQGVGDNDDSFAEIYDGVMDETMQRDVDGKLLQTSSYIVSIPLTQNDYGEYVIPENGDRIELERYGQILQLEVDNAEPSQLGGVSIYATRKNWW